MDASWTAKREGYDEPVFTITFRTDQGWAAWLVQEAAKAATEQVKNRLEEDKISQTLKRIHRQERKTGKWIPCSERLPELDEPVLATTAWDDITIAWRIGISKWFIHEGNTNAETDDVLAWMPLPELYKGE